MKNLKNKLFGEVKDLFPLLRSINSPGNDETLKYLKKKNNKIKIKSFVCGKKYNGWKIPKKWNCKEAYILDEKKNKILDFKNNNLHVLNYSTSINKILTLSQLRKKIFTIKSQPNLIPYKTSYYKSNWGFCMSFNQYKNLKKGSYKVVIKSFKTNENMRYGEIVIKGFSSKEILLSTNICHPSMASNELSGPVILNNLMKRIQQRKNFFTYRALFIPETIGSIAYINKNLSNLKKNIFCGLTLTCLGDDKIYSFIKSPKKDSHINNIILKILKNEKKKKIYEFTERGSDERSYCAPNVELDVGCFTRSKFGNYKEYHTSGDNLEFISKKGLFNSLMKINKVIDLIEKSKYANKYITSSIGEPKMDQYNLRDQIGAPQKFDKNKKNIMNIWVYCNGKNDENSISKLTKIKLFKVKEILSLLKAKKLITLKN